jgi:hypothetical protein
MTSSLAQSAREWNAPWERGLRRLSEKRCCVRLEDVVGAVAPPVPGKSLGLPSPPGTLWVALPLAGEGSCCWTAAWLDLCRFLGQIEAEINFGDVKIQMQQL